MRLEEEIFVGNVDFEEGDNVIILGGPFDSREAKIIKIMEDKSMVKAQMSMFGKETTIELGFSQIKKIS